MKVSILISILAWIPWKKLNSITKFTMPKSRTRLAEKRKEEEREQEEHKKLQSVMCFTQTKQLGKIANKKKCFKFE